MEDQMEKRLISTDINIQCVFIEKKIKPPQVHLEQDDILD